jgi:hypothetical protein
MTKTTEAKAFTQDAFGERLATQLMLRCIKLTCSESRIVAWHGFP